jgi:parallel beta-helix repeat protein
VLRNYVSGNGYANQLVSGNNTNNFGIGVISTATNNLIEENVIMGNANGILLGSNTRGNVIRQNVATGNPPVQVSHSYTAASCATPPCAGGDIRNNAPAGSNTMQDNHCITVVSTISLSPPPCRIFLPDPSLTAVVTGVALDSSRVPVNGSFISTFSGSNLTSQTYFDIRLRAPGASVDELALNWQQGPAARHPIAPGTAVGDWRITGVRAHQGANEHSGSFAPVDATISVFVSLFGF